MDATLSAAAVAKFNAPPAGAPASSADYEGDMSTVGDEGDMSTVDLDSRQASSESEAASSELLVSDEVIEECKRDRQTKRTRPAFEDVLVSLPHFSEARSDAEEDEDAVLRIGQLARRFALGR